MKIPDTPFYAVTFETSITIPGDERSRTHPGHGYPEHTVSTQEIVIFKTQKDFTDWVVAENAKPHGKRQFTPIYCTPLKLETRVQILISPQSTESKV